MFTLLSESNSITTFTMTGTMCVNFLITNAAYAPASTRGRHVVVSRPGACSEKGLSSALLCLWHIITSPVQFSSMFSSGGELIDNSHFYDPPKVGSPCWLMTNGDDHGGEHNFFLCMCTTALQCLCYASGTHGYISRYTQKCAKAPAQEALSVPFTEPFTIGKHLNEQLAD